MAENTRVEYSGIVTDEQMKEIEAIIEWAKSEGIEITYSLVPLGDIPVIGNTEDN